MGIAEDITSKVDTKETDTVQLRSRMDDDYSRWRNDTFLGAGEGYRAYTSNEAKNQSRLGVGMLSGAAMSVRVPQGNDDRDSRAQDNAKEQFILGNFRANDRRLTNLGLHPLRQEMSWYLPNRGITCGRATLVKRDGLVFADATPWDPRDTFWEYGAKGLEWLCLKTFMTRLTAEQEYGITSMEGEPSDVVLRYDYYDRERNTVIIPAIKLGWVKREVHGAVYPDGGGRVPGWVTASTLQPLILDRPTIGENATATALSSALTDWGESIYADNRKVFDSHQFIMSIWLELVARSRKPTFGIRSANGTRLVEFDPFQEGAEIPLAEGEELIVYDFLKSAGDAIVLASAISGEQQRGGFPVINFGETPAAISGFAMNILRGPTMHKIMPYAQAKGIALQQIASIWLDQFETGAFGQGIELSGLGSNRKWFSRNITMDDLRDLPDVEIEITPQLPEDDQAKIQTALAYRTAGPTGLPLLSDHDIREEKLERQDSDQDLDTIMSEMAGQNQQVQSQRMVDSLEKRGDMQGAAAWQMQWWVVVKQITDLLRQAGINPPSGLTPPLDSEQGGNQSPGFSPDVLPNASQGILPPTPGVQSPLQSGPLVEPGRPRPGAQGSTFDPFSRQ